MLIFVFLVILAVVFFGMGFWCKAHIHNWFDVCHELSQWGFVLGYLTVGAFVIAAIIAFVNNYNDEGFLAQNQAIRDGLVYQFENNMYDNDNDLGKKELYNQIVEWNSDLAFGKAWTHNPWFGIFWSDAYDDLEFIDFN